MNIEVSGIRVLKSFEWNSRLVRVARAAPHKLAEEFPRRALGPNVLNDSLGDAQAEEDASGRRRICSPAGALWGKPNSMTTFFCKLGCKPRCHVTRQRWYAITCDLAQHCVICFLLQVHQEALRRQE